MKILTIIIFGSTARFDNDENSDMDICVITKEQEEKEIVINAVHDILGNNINLDQCDFIIHHEEAFDFMLLHGALFLWHLKLECEPVYGAKYFKSKIKSLQDFTNYQYKFNHYLELLNDLEKARKRLPMLTEFDFAVLFTVVRNLSILICYKENHPKFGRRDAFEFVFKKHPILGMTIEEYDFLLQNKLSYERGVDSQLKDTYRIDQLISKVKVFAYHTKEILGFERVS